MQSLVLCFKALIFDQVRITGAKVKANTECNKPASRRDRDAIAWHHSLRQGNRCFLIETLIKITSTNYYLYNLPTWWHDNRHVLKTALKMTLHNLLLCLGNVVTETSKTKALIWKEKYLLFRGGVASNFRAITRLETLATQARGGA